MNPENYTIKTLIVEQRMVPFLDLPCCKRCGSLVGDVEAHDEDHNRRDGVAQAAFMAQSHTYDYTPYGR